MKPIDEDGPSVPIRGFAAVLAFLLVTVTLSLYCFVQQQYVWAAAFGVLAIWFVRLVAIVARATFRGERTKKARD